MNQKLQTMLEIQSGLTVTNRFHLKFILRTWEV